MCNVHVCGLPLCLWILFYLILLASAIYLGLPQVLGPSILSWICPSSGHVGSGIRFRTSCDYSAAASLSKWSSFVLDLGFVLVALVLWNVEGKRRLMCVTMSCSPFQMSRHVGYAFDTREGKKTEKRKGPFTCVLLWKICLGFDCCKAI